MSVRLPDWPARLAAFVEATRHAPFAWGRQDCCLWAVRAIDAMCGTRHAAAIVGQYDSAEGAVVYAASRGWQTVYDACRDVCGEALVRVGLAEDGDICARPLPDFAFGTALVRLGDRLIGPDERGLADVPFRAALVAPQWTAFPVGRGA